MFSGAGCHLWQLEGLTRAILPPTGLAPPLPQAKNNEH